MNPLQLPRTSIRIALAAGGTGGHVIPAVALAEAMREGPVAGTTFHPEVLLGCKGGMEENLARQNDLEFIGLPKPKAVGLKAKLQAPFRLTSAVVQAGKILRERRIDAVVGFGGYASAAPLIAAWLAKLPVILCEQNALPGRTNRWLSRFANVVVGQLAECAPHFPARCPVEILGNPLRHAVRELAAEQDLRRAAQSRTLHLQTTVLVMGGSQGAQPINKVLCESLPALKARIPNLRLICLTGEKNTVPIAERCRELEIPAYVEPFCNQMHELYRTTDFVVARSGATTLAELTALGLPMALIPFPQAMDDHQTCNALSLVNAGAAVLWPQSELTVERFTDRLVAVVSDRTRLENMKNASRNCGAPESCLRILARIADIVNGVHAAGERKAA